MKNIILILAILSIVFASCKKDNDTPDPEPNPVDTTTIVNQCYADFESDLQVNWKNGQVNFNNMSTDATNYLWNFGAGITSTEKNPSVIYNQTGVYTITLIVSNSKYSDTLVKENYIIIQDSSLYIIGDSLMVMNVDITGSFIYGGYLHVIGATDMFYGEINTQKIAESQYINPENCAGYIAYNFSAFGYDDWYLPAVKELNVLYNYKNQIGNFSYSYYISSTEYSNTSYYHVNMSDNFTEYTGKGISGNVRLLRKID